MLFLLHAGGGGGRLFESGRLLVFGLSRGSAYSNLGTNSNKYGKIVDHDEELNRCTIQVPSFTPAISNNFPFPSIAGVYCTDHYNLVKRELSK